MMDQLSHSAFSQRRWFTAMLGLSFLLSFCSATQADAPEKILRLYNWEDYMPQNILDGFKSRTGWQVDVVTYQSDELKDELLLVSGGEGLDLMIGSAASFQSYVIQGKLLAQLPKDLPNTENIEPRWYAMHQDLQDYVVPYLWGTLGIAYRKDKIKSPVNSWSALLQPPESLKGKIQMVEDMRDLFTPALKLLGGSVNEVDKARILAAGDLLLKQKPFVNTYQYIDITEKSELIRGVTWMALAYNGDAIALNQQDPNIVYTVPKEGTNFWVDCIAILEKSQNKDVAAQFISYINEPKNAAEIAESLYYATPNQAAYKLLPQTMRENPLIYPTPEVLKRSESVHPLRGRAAVYFNAQYSHLIE